MNNIADANATEMRGWVMLMLQRAAENVNPSECNDPAVLLACSLGSDSCPAACQKKADEKTNEEDTATQGTIDGLPIAGDLSIAVADYSSEVKSAPAVATVVFNAVDFKASEKVTIESVKVERTGLSDKSAIKWVWFEKDGVAVSAKASLSSDGTATTRFYNNYSVNGTETLDFVVELSGAAGSEIAFNIVGATSTAKNVSVNTKTTTYRTTLYNVATVKFAQNGRGTAADTDKEVSYKLGEKNNYEIGRFQLSNETKSSEDKDISIKSLKLRNIGNADLWAILKNVYVTRDGKTVSTRVELNSKDMVIYFDDELASGKRGIYTIFAEVASLDRIGDTIQLQLRKNTELVAQEKSTKFRVAYEDEEKYTGLDNGSWTLQKYKINGGKITFTNDSSLSKTVEAGASSTDVVIAKGTLTVAESIKLSNLTIEATTDSTLGTAPKNTKAGLVNSHIKTLKVEIGGSTYTATADATTDTTKVTYKISDDMYVSRTSDIKVLVNLSTDDDQETIKFTTSIQGSQFGNGEYDSNSETFTPWKVIAGAVNISNLTVKSGKFNITNKTSTTQKVVKGNSDIVTIFDGEITAKSGKVSVNDLYLKGTWTPADWAAAFDTTKDQISLTVYVNGEPYSDDIFNNVKEVKFSNLWDVEVGKSMKLKITAQPTVANEGSVTFAVSAKGTDDNGNPVEATAVNASKLQVTGGADVTVASSNASSTAVRDGSNAELLTFTSTVKDGSYDLNKVSIQLGKASTVLNKQSITLEIDGSAVDSITYCKESGTSCDSYGDKIVFSSLNETLAAGKHTFTLKANMNADTTDWADNTISITKVALDDELDANTSKVKSFNITQLVTKAFPTISASTSSEDLILKITNPTDSEENIEIEGIAVDGDIVTAYLNEKTIDVTQFNESIKDLAVSLAAGDSTEFRVQAANSSTVQVVALAIKAWNQHYVLTSDYTNVGKWTSFKVSGGDKASTAKVKLTANKATWKSIISDWALTSLTAAWDTTNAKQINTTVLSAEANPTITYAITAYPDGATASHVTVSASGLVDDSSAVAADNGPRKITVTAEEWTVTKTTTLTYTVNK